LGVVAGGATGEVGIVEVKEGVDVVASMDIGMAKQSNSRPGIERMS
jgi:hypothetical protein